VVTVLFVYAAPRAVYDAFSRSVKLAGCTSAPGVTASVVLTVRPGSTWANVLAPVAVQPSGKANERFTSRIVVLLPLWNVAVTSVACPGAFHNAGVVSSGVPKVSSTWAPPPSELAPSSVTVALRPVDTAGVLTCTTPPRSAGS
jgi:hypothetical protein